jgi:hypothetical protein
MGIEINMKRLEKYYKKFIMIVNVIWIKMGWKEYGGCIRCMDWRVMLMLIKIMID